jgi:hypothetical protein
MTSNTPRADDSLPADLVGIASMLDQAAGADRALPDASFEARIAAATRPRATSPLRLRGESHPAASEPHTGLFVRRVAWATRLAATVAIVGGVTLAWMASRTHTTTTEPRLATNATSPTNTDDSADMAFALAGWGEESTSSMDELRTQAESLHSSIHQGFDVSDMFSEEGAT